MPLPTQTKVPLFFSLILFHANGLCTPPSRCPPATQVVVQPPSRRAGRRRPALRGRRRPPPSRHKGRRPPPSHRAGVAGHRPSRRAGGRPPRPRRTGRRPPPLRPRAPSSGRRHAVRCAVVQPPSRHAGVAGRTSSHRARRRPAALPPRAPVSRFPAARAIVQPPSHRHRPSSRVGVAGHRAPAARAAGHRPSRRAGVAGHRPSHRAGRRSPLLLPRGLCRPSPS